MTTLLILILVMIVLGVIVGWAAGIIWKENRPIGVRGDYLVAVLSAVIIGVLDYFVIPAMGFSNTLRWVGVATEPWIGALLILWLIRYAKR